MLVLREKSEKKISEKVPVHGRNVTYLWEECEFIWEKGEQTGKAGLKSRGLAGSITFFPSFLPIAEGYLSNRLTSTEIKDGKKVSMKLAIAIILIFCSPFSHN